MSIYDFKLIDIDGKGVSMSKYKNKVLLIVNVASRCGFTSQYKELEKLYEDYKDDGFMILGFPSNQFMNQEPESESEIKNFCDINYHISFDMFSKIDVNGENSSDLYKFLKQEKSGILGIDSIKWNFTKFLISRDGDVIKRYAPYIKPEAIKVDIKFVL